jgi:hypothetical protein
LDVTCVTSIGRRLP